jgi:hypothetical protein
MDQIKECEQEASAIRAAIDVRRAKADRLAELGRKRIRLFRTVRYFRTYLLHKFQRNLPQERSYF